MMLVWLRVMVAAGCGAGHCILLRMGYLVCGRVRCSVAAVACSSCRAKCMAVAAGMTVYGGPRH